MVNQGYQGESHIKAH